MNLKQLQTFLTLSELKNFTKTAEQLHYAQSNVTAQIQQLEEELNVRLFERIGRTVALTSAGVELIPYAARILNLSKDLKRKFSNPDSGLLTIGASESVCISRLPSIIKSYQMEHPNVELYLKVLDTSDFIPLLADNTIDIAYILEVPIHNPDINTAAQIEETICVFTRPCHVLAKKQNLTIHDFSDQRLVLTAKECCYRKMFEKDLKEAAIKPKVVLETSSLQIIKETVLSGLGAGILPQSAIQREIDQKELVKLNYDTTGYKIASQLIYHKDKWMSQNLKDFINTVVNSGNKGS